MPSVRLCSTVCVVSSSRSLRSRNGTTFTPFGRMCSFSSSPSRECAPASRPSSRPSAAAPSPSTTSSSFTSLPSSRRYVLPICPSRIFGPCLHRRHVAHLQRGPVLALQHRLRNILRARKQPELPHVDLLLPLLNKAAARIHVVRRQLLLHLRDRQPVLRSASPDPESPGTPA